MKFATAALLALTMGAAGFSAAADTLKKVTDTGRIAISYRESSVPFSYIAGAGKPVGFSMDMADAVVREVKRRTGKVLEVEYVSVTSQNRIPLLVNGTIDLECGSTTNNADRQKQVSFTITHYVTANRFVSKKADNLRTLADLKGKTIVSTAGTTNIKQMTELNAQQNLGMNILSAKDHAESFLMVETGRAAAFFMDDILLAGLVANHANPGQWVVSADPLSIEPYGIMLRKDDPAFKKVVDGAMTAMYKSGEVGRLYMKWFQSAIPPRGINLNTPMSDSHKKVAANPTDSPDPAVYR